MKWFVNKSGMELVRWLNENGVQLSTQPRTTPVGGVRYGYFEDGKCLLCDDLEAVKLCSGSGQWYRFPSMAIPLLPDYDELLEKLVKKEEAKLRQVLSENTRKFEALREKLMGRFGQSPALEAVFEKPCPPAMIVLTLFLHRHDVPKGEMEEICREYMDTQLAIDRTGGAVVRNERKMFTRAVLRWMFEGEDVFKQEVTNLNFLKGRPMYFFKELPERTPAIERELRDVLEAGGFIVRMIDDGNAVGAMLINAESLQTDDCALGSLAVEKGDLQ